VTVNSASGEDESYKNIAYAHLATCCCDDRQNPPIGLRDNVVYRNR